MIRAAAKERMHPRNRFRAGYDFGRLVAASPALGPFVRPNPYGDPSIDWADPRAVKALNQALLTEAYGIAAWDIPAGALCPPVPGRSDYVHAVADLLGGGKAASIPRGRAVRVLDIGMGADAIYPLIGASEYGWRFVGTDIDARALGWAARIVAANPRVAGLIECRLQTNPREVFRGVIPQGERFDATMCNPPFHRSAAEAVAGNERKRRNLGAPRGRGAAALNFGGQAAELWCPGGELGFVTRMIDESVEFRDACLWFTTLVSKSEHLPRLRSAARDAGAREVKVIEMAQGQKQSRVLAWTFAPAPALTGSRKRL